MAAFQKFADIFSTGKSTRSSTGSDRDDVIHGNKKRTRLINDSDWIKNKPSDETPNQPADVNYGKTALSRAKSQESLNSDPSGTNKLKPTKSDTIDGRKRDTSGTADTNKTQRASTLDRPTSSEPAHDLQNKVVLHRFRSEEFLNRDTGSTNITSPTSKFSTSDRKNRTSSYKTDDAPKMTIITSESKTVNPTSKSPQSRPTPDGQVTTQEKSPAKPILKWGSQKDETSGSGNTPKSSTLERNTVKTSPQAETASLIDLTPTTENTSKGTSDFTSKFGMKSLIDLSITPEQPSKRTSDVTPTTPVRTSSLDNLARTTPDKPKRNSGEWDNTSSYTTAGTKAAFDPPSRKSRNSGDWNNVNLHTTTSTKTTFDPTSRNSSSDSEDLDNTSSYTKSSKTTNDPKTSNSRRSGDWDNTSSYTITSTKTTPDPILKSSRSTSEQTVLNDEPSTHKSSTSYIKTSRTYSSDSPTDKSPVTEDHLYNSRSTYKENSPLREQDSDDDESSVYQSSRNSLKKSKSPSSPLSEGKAPAKVITLTTAFTSAEQPSKDKNVCSQCYKPISKGARMILEDLNINCHASCFKCQICHSSLENLNAGDNFWVHHRTVHCEPCYDKVKAQWAY
ncbi:sciellin isoform X2 [Heptranchias perlo]|uniref:sciellin isoform X2 n=1 Tax=Heptranchias perlo TaxID=212740 RepID=UPI00355A3935